MCTSLGSQNCAVPRTPSATWQGDPVLRLVSELVSPLLASMRRIALRLSTTTNRSAAGLHATLLIISNFASNPSAWPGFELPAIVLVRPAG